MLGRTRTQSVEAAMHVRILMFVITADNVEDTRRLLRAGGAIEIDQGMTVHALAQDRKILANDHPIDIPLGRFVHKTICSNRRGVAIYSRPQHRHPPANCFRIRPIAWVSRFDEENGDRLLAASRETAA